MQIGFWGLLGLLFIGLKLSGVIAWSWLWVLAPFWVATLIFVIVCCIAFVIGSRR